MKILHVINGLNRGGTETVLYRLVAASASEAEHVIVSLTGEGLYGPRLGSWASPFTLCSSPAAGSPCEGCTGYGD